jgi:LacI family transcriptional regulator
MAKRQVSLKDLAQELNVSISTVSRALKNHPDISPELTVRVKALATSLKYTTNPLAMGLLKQQTRMIGVIVPDLVTHFYASIIWGIEQEAKKEGYYLVISSSNESMEKEVESVQNLLKTRVDGLIVCLSRETDSFSHFEQLIDNEVPLVFFDRVCLPGKVPAVEVDNWEAAANITRHFYQNGYRRIAYLSGPPQLNISKERLEGYLKGLEICGLKFENDLLVQCNLTAEDATRATAQLLDLPNLPDAIFGINDTVAFAAMKEIKRRGLKIPDDIGLIGFTDDFHATFTDPQLTSVMHPTEEMGRTAAKLFFESIGHPGFAETVKLPTTLVVRESSVKKGH